MTRKIYNLKKFMLDCEIHLKFLTYTEIVQAVVHEYIYCFNQLDPKELHFHKKEYFNQLRLTDDEIKRLSKAYVYIYIDESAPICYLGKWPYMPVAELREEAVFAISMAKKLRCRELSIHGVACESCDKMSLDIISKKNKSRSRKFFQKKKRVTEQLDDIRDSKFWESSFIRNEIDDELIEYIRYIRFLSDKIEGYYKTALILLSRIAMWYPNTYECIYHRLFTPKMREVLTHCASLFSEIIGKPFPAWTRPWELKSPKELIEELHYSEWLFKISQGFFNRQTKSRSVSISTAEKEKHYMKNVSIIIV